MNGKISLDGIRKHVHNFLHCLSTSTSSIAAHGFAPTRKYCMMNHELRAAYERPSLVGSYGTVSSSPTHIEIPDINTMDRAWEEERREQRKIQGRQDRQIVYNTSLHALLVISLSSFSSSLSFLSLNGLKLPVCLNLQMAFSDMTSLSIDSTQAFEGMTFVGLCCLHGPVESSSVNASACYLISYAVAWQCATIVVTLLLGVAANWTHG